MNKFAFALLLFLCLGVAGFALYAYGVLEPGTTVAPAMKVTYREHRARILTHVFFSVVALVTGPFQFMTALRTKRPALHRQLGYFYFAAVFGGGVAGLAMAFVAYGGLVSTFGFGMLATLWLFTAAQALLAVKKRDYALHQTWAIRCFALTFAAVTLRIYMGIFFAAGVPMDSFYPAVSWLCWVPNVLVVEWLILRKR